MPQVKKSLLLDAPDNEQQESLWNCGDWCAAPLIIVSETAFEAIISSEQHGSIEITIERNDKVQGIILAIMILEWN